MGEANFFLGRSIGIDDTNIDRY